MYGFMSFCFSQGTVAMTRQCNTCNSFPNWDGTAGYSDVLYNATATSLCHQPWCFEHAASGRNLREASVNVGTIAPPMCPVFQVPELPIGVIVVGLAVMDDRRAGLPLTDLLYDVAVRTVFAI